MAPGAAPCTDTRERPCPDASTRSAVLKGQNGLVAPTKALRLLTMLSDGLDELNGVALDEAARRSLIAAYGAALVEVASTVCDPLIDELVALRFAPLDPGATADEIRVAQAQLFGWLNGLILADDRFSTPPALATSDVRP